MQSEAVGLQPLNVASLRVQIVSQMREAILGGGFRPGQRLIETLIAERLGVSRAPIREALAALEREGLVVTVPRRGSFVIDFTDQDIEEIYSLRLLLEVGALPRVLARLTTADLAGLQGLVDQLGRLVEQGGAEPAVVGLDLQFHETLCRLAGHGRLLAVWESMRWQTQLLIGLTERTHRQQPAGPRAHHQRILDALAQGDPVQAEDVLRAHIADAQARALAALQAWRCV